MDYCVHQRVTSLKSECVSCGKMKEEVFEYALSGNGPFINAKRVHQKFGLSRHKASRILKDLTEEGRLQLVDGDKKPHLYRVPVI